jgi:hypothetical protein
MQSFVWQSLLFRFTEKKTSNSVRICSWSKDVKKLKAGQFAPWLSVQQIIWYSQPARYSHLILPLDSQSFVQTWWFEVNHITWCEGKAISLQAWTGPEGSRRLRLPEFPDNRHMKVVRSSAIRTGRFTPPGNISWYSFLLEAESTARP